MKEIQYQQEGMLFQLEYQHSICSYEILVNDMPVMIHFAKGDRSGLTVNINQYILKPGKQEVTIRMFPSKTGENIFAKSSDLSSYVKILISKQKRNADLNKDWQEISDGIKFQWDILTYQTLAGASVPLVPLQDERKR
ncbi:hypothetical protein [Chryseobacterium binzhouense]|uniref:hypothetical protein n=1 Tax=Chryseobacterium binzhouense TaxID=2593646 RepID=UPI002896F157|nr:hypothetical protein [Chryseobacterium binzhouense]